MRERDREWEAGRQAGAANLFTTAVEKAAKKAVYAKRFRSCHIGPNTCRSAPGSVSQSPGLLHLIHTLWQFGAHTQLQKRGGKTERNTHYIQFVEY